MSSFDWRDQFKTKFLSGDDLRGAPRHVTIAKIDRVPDQRNLGDWLWVATLKELRPEGTGELPRLPDKPWKINRNTAAGLAHLHGSNEMADWCHKPFYIEPRQWRPGQYMIDLVFDDGNEEDKSDWSKAVTLGGSADGEPAVVGAISIGGTAPEGGAA